MGIILALITFLIGAFLIISFRKIPIRNVGQIKIFGNRKEGAFKKEGWRFLPLRPLWYDVDLIDIGKVPFEVIVEKALTPDGANSRVPIDIVFDPLPEKLIEYINAGGKEGAKEQFRGKIMERVREWCYDEEEGPSDWKELNKSHLEGTSILIKKIARNSITEIPDYAQEVPTWIWLRYFSLPQPKKFLKNEEIWAKNDWDAVKKVLRKIEDENGEDKITVLKEAIKKRREEVSSIRTGSGKIVVEDLGIILKRINIGDIDVLGEVAKNTDKTAKEKLEREAEDLELNHVLTQVQKFIDLGYSRSEAMEVVQTEREKVGKNINEHKINISQATTESLEKIFGPLVNSVIEKFFK